MNKINLLIKIITLKVIEKKAQYYKERRVAHYLRRSLIVKYLMKGK